MHAVTMKVTPCLRVECRFWLGEDGWQGSCEQPPITVHADSFEEAKSNIESALGKHIEQLLQDKHTNMGHAA